MPADVSSQVAQLDSEKHSAMEAMESHTKDVISAHLMPDASTEDALRSLLTTLQQVTEMQLVDLSRVIDWSYDRMIECCLLVVRFCSFCIIDEVKIERITFGACTSLDVLFLVVLVFGLPLITRKARMLERTSV